MILIDPLRTAMEHAVKQPISEEELQRAITLAVACTYGNEADCPTLDDLPLIARCLLSCAFEAGKALSRQADLEQSLGIALRQWNANADHDLDDTPSDDSAEAMLYRRLKAFLKAGDDLKITPPATIHSPQAALARCAEYFDWFVFHNVKGEIPAFTPEIFTELQGIKDYAAAALPAEPKAPT